MSELEGKLIPATLVQDTWVDFVANVRAKLLGMPSRLAHQMIATEDYAEAEKLLKDCVYDALNELAEDGIPTEYAGRVEKHDADI